MNALMRVADRIADRFASAKIVKPLVPIIPTWEVDKPVRLPHDFRRFGEEGYRSNVIIFSCVIFISTSIAEPQLQLFKKKKSGSADLITDHVLSAVLAQPNADATG